jgi:hypothetical protein
LAKVEAGARVVAALTRIGDAAEDAGKVVERMAPRLDRFGRRLELAHRKVVQTGNGLVQVLVDGIAQRLIPSRRRVVVTGLGEPRLPGLGKATGVG